MNFRPALLSLDKKTVGCFPVVPPLSSVRFLRYEGELIGVLYILICSEMAVFGRKCVTWITRQARYIQLIRRSAAAYAGQHSSICSIAQLVAPRV